MVNFLEKVSARELDSVFAALSNAKRREMVNDLAYRPSTVSQLAVQHQLSLPAIHKHIRALEKAHLLNRRKVGRVNFVALNHKGLQVVQAWCGQYRTEWGSDKQTLTNYIANFTN